MDADFSDFAGLVNRIRVLRALQLSPADIHASLVEGGLDPDCAHLAIVGQAILDSEVDLPVCH
jgi:hypothetical protein